MYRLGDHLFGHLFFFVNHRLIAHFALTAVAIIYGLNYIIAKEVLDGEYLTPFQFIFFRVIGGMILFWMVSINIPKHLIEKSDYGRLFICALTGVAINQLCFFQGLKYTSAIHASLLITLVPIIVLITAAILIKEKITKRKMIGIALGIIGAIYLITTSSSGNDPSSLYGDVFILINATSYGFYLVLVKRLLLKYHPIIIVKWIFTLGLFIVAPFGISGIHQIDWPSFSIGIWIAIGYVIFFTTFLAFLLNALALKRVSPSIVSSYIYLQPLIASIVTISLGKDTFGMDILVSGGLIFIGVYMVSTISKNVISDTDLA